MKKGEAGSGSGFRDGGARERKFSGDLMVTHLITTL